MKDEERALSWNRRLLTCTMLMITAGLCSTTTLRVGDRPEFAVRQLRQDFIDNAGAVYRRHDITFDVESEHRAIMHVTTVVTVFKKEERDHGEFVIPYDRFGALTDLDATLYDADGEEIRTLEKQDTKDYSAISDYSLYEDARVRYVQLYHDQYPYTVEITYEVTYNGYLAWPTWYAQPSDLPTEESRFVVTLPATMLLRHWTNNDSLRPVQNREGNRTTYSWKAIMLSSIPDELKNENREDLTTVVRIAPARFSLEGFEGDLSTWQSFGEWYHRLSTGRDQLPVSAAQQVDSIVRGLETPRDKARSLYHFLQSRTRYVSIQLGIGGWQPFDATYVHERGYGDCKALSNYMVSLLKRAGVRAYPTLIAHGTFAPPLKSDFPSNQFNHAIVCIPLEHDTVWLECTSQSMPFGRVGQSNENRNALVITDQGGILVHVPASTSRRNFQRRTAYVVLSGSGDAEATVETTVGGNQENDMQRALAGATPIERERWITNEVGIPGMRLVKYFLQGLETKEDVVAMSIRLSLPHYGSTTGERIFLNPNLMERRTVVPPERSTKRSPVRFAYQYIDSDSIVYRIPTNYMCEALPPPTVLATPFGAFTSVTSCIGDSLIIFGRMLEIKAPEIPPDRHSEYRNFFSSIVKADRGQVVLIRR